MRARSGFCTAATLRGSLDPPYHQPSPPTASRPLPSSLSSATVLTIVCAEVFVGLSHPTPPLEVWKEAKSDIFEFHNHSIVHNALNFVHEYFEPEKAYGSILY
jgi:hypothetical protein